MEQKDYREFSRARRSECACNNLRKAGRAITRLYDEELRPSGLRVTQYGILGATMMLEPVTVTRLADETVTDRTTLTRNLKILEDRGFISIREGNDRREREVSLTKEGRQAVASAYPFWKKAQARVMKELGERQWESLREGLAAVVSLSRE